MGLMESNRDVDCCGKVRQLQGVCDKRIHEKKHLFMFSVFTV